MRWDFWRKRDWRTVGQRYAAEHSAWLTRAVRLGNAPRIPVKKVEEGGFDRMMARPGGEERASQWWGAAFERVD